VALIVAVSFGLAVALKSFDRIGSAENDRLSETNDESRGTSPRSPEDSLLEFVQTPWTGDIDGMLERRLIRVLIVPNQTSYFLEQGKPRGVAAEFYSAFEKFVNKRFPPKSRHLKVKVVMVPTRRDDLFPALLEGRGDIANSALTITSDRKEQVAFSAPVVSGIDEIVVSGPASPRIETLHDLAGKEILVRKSSSYWEHLQHLNERFDAEGREPIELLPAPEQLTDEDLMQMLNAGLVELIVVDDYRAELWSKILPDIRLHQDIVIHSRGEIGVAIRQGSPRLRDTLNAFIEAHKVGTSFGNTVTKRYLGNKRFVERANKPAEPGKFEQIEALFAKYGKEYRLDPLLLMAQGYQESRLDQAARSATGAVGIMQLLPSTAKELNVGDIHQVEPNIHAGAKYVRFIIDNYFDDPGVDDLNKTLFAFAAYNAGPNRIRRLREVTRERRLDPNAWFGNVELIVSEKAGGEPVTYVSNIFQYYVGLKLLEHHHQSKRHAREAFEESRR
jgi:membrane-bound lytic murein transglycosylase MltF